METTLEQMNKLCTDLVTADKEDAWTYAEAMCYDLYNVELLMRAFVAACGSAEDRLTYLEQVAKKG
jgi:hypothetical protein